VTVRISAMRQKWAREFQISCGSCAIIPDYPRSKLDIKLVIEHDDHATRLAIEAMRLPATYEIVVAPAGWPWTKPRALNIALPLVRGEFLVIFDAEDAPAPGQLREAAERFLRSSREFACLQARLAIDNIEDSWLTRLFAIEYAVLFDVLNPGLAGLGLPLPLGGSSNHFRTAVLREVCGWDAWNVTEDADLGLRLARLGFRVDILPSSTQEEAPARLDAWLTQRRRWSKGWMQTFITLTRDPRRLVFELGAANSLALALLMTGLVIAPPLWPFFAALVVHDLSAGLPSPASALPLIETVRGCRRVFSGRGPSYGSRCSA
jgi:glycosyltransferase XagB